MSSESQQPDTTPGNYYISCHDGGRVWLLSGPYVNNHALALSLVEKAQRLASAANAWSDFFKFGTLRHETDRPGNFQKCGFDLNLEKVTG